MAEGSAQLESRESASPNPFADVWRFRELVTLLVARDLKVRYKRSVLGMFWTLLNPLLQMAVYAFVFSVVMKVGVAAYPVFLLAGLLPWNLFVGSVSLGAGTLLANASLIRKVRVPQAVYPLAVVGSKLVDFALSLVPFLLLALVNGRTPTLPWLFVVPGALLLVAFAIGGALLISSLTVFFRDAKHLIDIILQVWFYLTPILYSLDSLRAIRNPWIGWGLRLNPATPLIRCFQLTLYENRWPDWMTVSGAAMAGFGMLGLGLWVFLRAESRHIHYL